ncbi:hypothetical protein BUALT_Bualt08G0057500 [Buddleja alternifolia]|uniref:Uncharacterized protein n=1 Tax=Buddleja alternifolia TaxID=168488 RepID=A0AAV6X836_9LAMI|nr:hypothetical protein BUALT_Bualt08G0057500 [Buddleja alternifolia]
MAKRVTMVPVRPIDQSKSESASKSPLEQEQTSNSKDLEHQGDGEMIQVIELESMAVETIEMARESQDILGKGNQHPEVNLKPQTVSLHSHATFVTVFNGLNFSEWREQVNFHLGVLDLDLALLEEKPADITDESSDTEKLKQSVTAKEYLKLVEERFRSADKSLAGTLMAELTTMKYDGSRSMQQHVLEMTNTAARLKSLVLTVDDSFLGQFILNSLPPDYGPFQINFNTIKDKWDVMNCPGFLTIQSIDPSKNFLFMGNQMKAPIEGIGTY